MNSIPKTDSSTINASNSDSRIIKPRTEIAMRELLEKIECSFPLYAPEASICQNKCIGCPKKMMEFLETEYEYWQQALSDNETPTLGDIQKLAKSSKKIHKVLLSNGITQSGSDSA